MKKKILFLLYQLNGGGAENRIIDIANKIDKAKYDVTIKTIIQCKSNEKILNKDIKYKYIFKGLFKEDRIFFKFFYMLKPEVLYNIFIKEHYDIEIAALEGIPTKIISGGNKGTKKIAVIHADANNIAWPSKRYKNFEQEVRSYGNLDNLIFVSYHSMISFTKKFNITLNNASVLYNPFDIDYIKKLSTEVVKDYIKGTNTLFCAIGRLDYVKGFDRLIKIFSEVYINNPKIELIIIGEGAERNKLEKLIEECNLQGIVHLLGYKENPYKYLRISDYYICSSYSEGLSSTVIESMIVGTRIIATNCGGMEEILAGSDNIIIDNSMQGLKEGILLALKEKEKKISSIKNKNSNNDYLSKFSYTNYFEKLEKIFEV